MMTTMMKGSSHLLLLLLGLLISTQSVVALQEELNNARELWTDQNVTLYKLGFTRDGFFTPEFTTPYLSIVENENKLEVINVTEGVAVDPNSIHFRTAYTVEKLFQMIQDAIDTKAVEIDVEYDTTFGYPKTVFINKDELTDDEEITVEIDSFFPMMPILDSLSRAEALWGTMGPSSYLFTFQHVCRCPAARPLRVKVVDGKIQTVTSSSDSDTTNILDGSGLVQAIPELFVYLHNVLMLSASSMMVDFDEKYGFPMFIRIDEDAFSDGDEIRFMVHNFTDLSLPTMPPTKAPVVATSTPGETSPPSISPYTFPTATPTRVPVADGSTDPVAYPYTSAPTAMPVTYPNDIPATYPQITTFSPGNLFDGTAKCSNYSACVGLVDDCCPTVDGVFLDCCFEQATNDRYRKKISLIGPEGSDEQAYYFASTNAYTRGAAAPVNQSLVVSYTRNPTQLYDLIYYDTSVITDPSEFMDGRKKFYMDFFSTVPSCTKVLLQFDSLPLAEAPYPTGRHARFVAFTGGSQTWERLEFVHLDQPDLKMDLGFNPVNALVLFFAPGTKTSDTYYFRNLDIAVVGCDEMTQTCEAVVHKSCSVFLEGKICNDGDGAFDCDVGCSTDPVCVKHLGDSLETAAYQLAAPGSASSMKIVTNILSIAIMGIIMFGSMA